MILSSLGASCFRNFDQVEFQPCETVNIISGNNAQGKTNLIEAIWLFTGSKSFRGVKDSEMIHFETRKAKLTIDFEAKERKNSAKIEIESSRKAYLNNVELSTPTEMIGEFCAVVFSPDHLNLIKEGPVFRRRFLDSAICQIRPRFTSRLIDYRRALMQRNALLKDIPRHSELYDTLEIWDEKLSTSGAFILFNRLKYLKKLEEKASGIFRGITKENEEISLRYLDPDMDFPHDLSDSQKVLKDLKQQLLSQLRKKTRSDIENGFTQSGPHRDDIGIMINQLSARLYGSQGQQRTAVLSLKLAEASVLRDIINEPPILLLDDVMSELDQTRQDYLLNHIDGWQVFITCCDPSGYQKLSRGSIFDISCGTINETWV